MAMTFCYAETGSNHAVNNALSSELNFDMRRLAVKLDLTSDQMEAVQVIHDNLNDDLADLSACQSNNRFEHWMLFDKAIKKDIHHMRQVLNDKQFQTYMQLFGTTLHNRIMK